MHPKLTPSIAVFVTGLLLGSAYAFLSPSPRPTTSQAPIPNSSEPTPAASASLPSAATSQLDSAPLTPDSFARRFATANAIENDRLRAWELERIFQSMSAADAPAILQRILSDPEYHKAYGALGPFFAKWGQLDGSAAFAAARTLEGNQYKDALKYLFPSWMKSDNPNAWAAAIEVFDKRNADKLPPGWRLSYRWLRGLTAETARHDPDGLFRFATQNPKHMLSRQVDSVFLEQASESNNHAQLLEKFSQTEDPKQRLRLTGELFASWAAHDSASAQITIEALGENNENSAAMTGFLMGLFKADQAQALDYILNNQDKAPVKATLPNLIFTSALQGSYVENVRLIDTLVAADLLESHAHRFTSTPGFLNPAASLYAVQQLPSGETRSKLTAKAISNLAGYDYDVAYEYYQQLDSTAEKASALPSLTRSLFKYSDGGAQLVSLLEQAPDQESRITTIDSLLKQAEQTFDDSSVDYRSALELISESEPALSTESQAIREKLFGPKSEKGEN